MIAARPIILFYFDYFILFRVRCAAGGIARISHRVV